MFFVQLKENIVLFDRTAQRSDCRMMVQQSWQHRTEKQKRKSRKIVIPPVLVVTYINVFRQMIRFLSFGVSITPTALGVVV